MDANIVIAVVSMAIAIGAFIVALVQVNMQTSVEARRKGKVDALAIGDWAVTWPLTQLFIFHLLHLLPLTMPPADPRIQKTPFITTGALWDYLLREARHEKRSPLARRMASRLVEKATEATGQGRGRFSGRMYAVRPTTRKSSEACWSDALHMCGISRRYWSDGLATEVGAQTCDGAIRPASAVTNLHSLVGFARAMGLRRVERDGNKRVSLGNGGASIYADLNHGDNNHPTPLAHFTGSPIGRYHIVDEMSQQTGESVYADAMWACGCVPDERHLIPWQIFPDGSGKYRDENEVEMRVDWPGDLSPPMLDRSNPDFGLFRAWASGVLAASSTRCPDQQGRPKCEKYNKVGLAELVRGRHGGIISCIRTFAKSTLSTEQLKCGQVALWWCVQHWWMDPYQGLHAGPASGQPGLPPVDIGIIGCEFVTDLVQARLWCDATLRKVADPVNHRCWEGIVEYARRLSASEDIDLSGKVSLGPVEAMILTRVLQLWKLRVIVDKLCPEARESRHIGVPLPQPLVITYNPHGILLDSGAVCEIMLLEMALMTIATDNAEGGDTELNKEIDIEFG